MPNWIALIFAVVLMASCGPGGGSSGTQTPSPFGPTGIPPALRGDDAGGTRISPGRGLPESLKENAGVVLDPNEIYYTDPDAEDPTSISEELKQLLADVPDEGPWRNSYTNAFKEAKRTDKPVLMWFTDSQNSPNCRQLSEDLFNKREFDDWAAETFVRLQFDQQVGSGRLGDDQARKKYYVKEMKKRYKVLGTPTLIVLTPAGEVVSKYRGYSRGQSEFRWGQLRQAAKLAGEANVAWKAKMEKKGYRTWRDPRGREYFAKLVLYSKGELVLVEPDGTRAKTKERYLSPADQEWIAGLKRARGLE